ncbi:Ig-like domain-containing protein, partial [Flavobacterium polysaccharolyticum]
IAAFSPATSTRCQGAGAVTTTTTATNSTGITYSLDAASLTAGNSINASTGEVTYVAGWSGSTTITASAAGCNGPATTTHVVTVNPLPAANLVLNGTSPICSGTGTNITVVSSVVGVNYQLRTGTTNVGTAVAGDGGTINLPTGNLTATTTFNVLATNATTSCSIQLTETEEVTVNNCPPVASNSTINVAEESTNTALGLAAPTDPDSGVLTITVTGLPTLGTVTLANGTTITNGQMLTSAQLIGLQYDAPVDYNGTDSVGNFTYSVSDGNTTVSGQTTI